MRLVRFNNSNGRRGTGFNGWHPPFLCRGITHSYANVSFSLWDRLFGTKTIRKHLDRGDLWMVGKNDYRLRSARRRKAA